MAKYVLLGTWTAQGIASVKDPIDRSEAFRAMVSGTGGTVTELVWWLRRYEVMTVFDAPDEETAAVSMQLSGVGAIRTETPRAFTDGEPTGILGMPAQADCPRSVSSRARIRVSSAPSIMTMP